MFSVIVERQFNNNGFEMQIRRFSEAQFNCVDRIVHFTAKIVTVLHCMIGFVRSLYGLVVCLSVLLFISLLIDLI